MIKKLICAAAAVSLVFALAACEPASTGSSVPSSEAQGSSEPASVPASSQTASAAELDAGQRSALKDYENAVSNRSTYLSCIAVREFTTGDVTSVTTLTWYTPYGLGAFFFKKVSTVNGAPFVTESYTGSVYSFESDEETVSIGSSGYSSAILPRLAKGDKTHLRMPPAADFDYASLTVTSLTHGTDSDGNITCEIVFASADGGRLLSEFGAEGEYIAENIKVSAVMNDEEVLLSEDFTFTLVRTSDGSRTECRSLTTLSSINAVERFS